MPSTPVQPTDAFLNHLQANILKGHGRDFAHHLFFQVDKEKAAEARQWIAAFAASQITSAKKQFDATKAFNDKQNTDGGTVITLSLSAKGYDALGLQAKKPTSTTFRNGMAARAVQLGDKPGKLEEPFKQPIHLLVIVADDSAATAKNKADDIIGTTSAFLKLVVNQRGNVLKKEGLGIEHFGYADGISQPLFLAGDISQQPSTTVWDDTTDLDLLLLPDPGATAPDCFGSFLVFRKLEQNVKTFKQGEKNLPAIENVDGKPEPELAGAMLVGRFENGVPVIKASTNFVSNPPPKPTNDFDYKEDDGILKCPFHAHIRLMNPRNGDPEAGPLPKQRITRRGIPFDDVKRIAEADINKVTEDMLEENQPESGVGLLFMCYQSNIATQFEILQEHWANEGNIGGHIVDGQDSLIGQGTNPPKTLPQQWGQPAQTSPFSFHGFVTMKGGEYFFTPSISFLKTI